MIIETSCNHFYRVTETNDEALAHVWYGIEVKFTKGQWEVKKRAYRQLVRKAATRVVEV